MKVIMHRIIEKICLKIRKYATVPWKNKEKETDNVRLVDTKKQYKERPKQYTYKPMTDQEILDARRKIGL